jgi:DNA polymerase
LEAQEDGEEMKLLTVDFETYYDKAFSLSKLTTEEYIRDDRFEVIGVAVQVDDDPPEWFSGTQKETAAWLDTLCMARAIHGVEAGGSLKALAERYKLGAKGDEVINALGKRRVDFSGEDLDRYGAYCRNDVRLTYDLFTKLVNGFPQKELKVIDLTLRMFVEPVLELNLPLLEAHLETVKEKKAKLLAAAEADRDSLMSNDKFADLLTRLGVDPPKKISPRTQKETWAFAKTDEEFKELLTHPDPRVQTLVGARLGTKTTLEETRTQRFMDIALRGNLPVPIRYYAAHTGRWGGDDKINLQNLPRESKLKHAIVAPKGYVMIDCDSSQIEARTVAWIAGQQDLVNAFDKGEDVRHGGHQVPDAVEGVQRRR